MSIKEAWQADAAEEKSNTTGRPNEDLPMESSAIFFCKIIMKQATLAAVFEGPISDDSPCNRRGRDVSMYSPAVQKHTCPAVKYIKKGFY
jgi:hypothetical protein